MTIYKTQLFAWRLLSFIFLCFLLSSCETGYLIKNSYYQLQLLNQRKPIETILLQDQLSGEEKRKLNLAQEAKTFAEEKMGLTATKNYTSYVPLEGKYLSYVVSAAEKWKLQPIQWYFPITGTVPYKGFFKESQAEAFEQELLQTNVDTYRRGVSAFSTLGWFDDPIYSSMLNYQDEDLVNTIIHETVHATIYIPSSADFNERLATFLGNQGTLEFYRQKEGPESPTVKRILDNNLDEALFAEFISTEIINLELWYPTIQSHDENLRQKKFQQIQSDFLSKIQPKMKTKHFQNFSKIPLNNARILALKTYIMDQKDFESVFKKMNNNFHTFLEKMKSLKNKKKPEEILKTWAHATSSLNFDN